MSKYCGGQIRRDFPILITTLTMNLVYIKMIGPVCFLLQKWQTLPGVTSAQIH